MLPYDIDYVMSQWGRGKFLLETLLELRMLIYISNDFAVLYIIYNVTNHINLYSQIIQGKVFFLFGGKGEIMPHHINM